MLVSFLAKRVAVMAMMAASAAFIIDGLRPFVPLGILLGAFLGVYRTRLAGRALENAVQGTRPAKGALLQLLSQMMLFSVLVATALANWRLFAGVAGGLLLLPLFICANAATEWLGLTRNAWGEAGTAKER